MRTRFVGPTLLLIIGLAGCDGIRSKEEQCLQSARLEFKDPDSLAVVENMGLRGQVAGKDDQFFWLRYKAKNSYGAYISGNMACSAQSGKWARDRSREELAISKIYARRLAEATQRLNDRTDAIQACKTKDCWSKLTKGSSSGMSPEDVAQAEMARAKKEATETVLEGIDPL